MTEQDAVSLLLNLGYTLSKPGSEYAMRIYSGYRCPTCGMLDGHGDLPCPYETATGEQIG